MPLSYYLFGFIAIQGDTETGTAVAGTLDETISKYEQEKRGVSAAYASPWVFTAHNYSSKCTSAGAYRVPSPKTKGSVRGLRSSAGRSP